MAIGGPGEEQNAVLARAVIGGVAVGTITTLLFVPFLYSVIGRFTGPRTEFRRSFPAKDHCHELSARDLLLRDYQKPKPDEKQRRRLARVIAVFVRSYPCCTGWVRNLE